MNPAIIKAYAIKIAANTGKKPDMDEAEADMVRVIRKVARGLAAKHTYGYHSPADIEQDAIVLALEVLSGEAYDPSRPLENFLYVHVKRRLRNNIRKHYYRGEPPCSCCSMVNPPAEPCKKWLDWRKRNISKQNLMRPLDVSCVNDEHEPRMATPSSVAEEATVNELLQKIDRLLPINLRADYLRMREHIIIPKVRRQRVRQAILSIMEEGSNEPRA